jgi:inorganic pyrophosphatase
MGNLHQLPARDPSGAFHVVIESPRGSQVKLKYAPELSAFTLSRPLVLGVCYPFDFGFIPATRAPDGDPLDALVLLDAATYPGVVLPCRALGVVQVEQNRKQAAGRERNDRVIAVPVKAPRSDDIRDARQLPSRLRSEIEQFFLTVVLFEAKGAVVLGWGGKSEAEALVDRAAGYFAKDGKTGQP